ncbi:hypothetical protein L1049_000535 [Liquidambar formosana]|uniref:Wax synthase domain-containing protein n=1 Tax=Liquidambar formosana TaxID=63359 RepID=A0AAP0N8Y9_LIQFO
MGDEIKSFIKVWITAITSLCYCYYGVAHIPRGMIRLLSLLPIFYLFTILPLNLYSFHLGAPTAFFLVWLANFKLLLFAFDLGPLSSHPPKPLLHFISIACLPIQIKQDPSPKSPPNIETSPKTTNNTSPSSYNGTKVQRSLLLAIKVVLLASIISLYDYKQYLHPNVVLALYCCHMYLGVEIVLAMCAAPARTLLGLELEPQFHEPYLATSLQDFWGRRWNLMVTSILRPTVYDPLRRISIHILGRRWAPLPAICAAFVVSGLMHELLYYYFTRVSPTWEVTWFFVLHGVCTALEVVVKKVLTGRCRLHRAVSGPLAVGFVAVTGVWLFLPQVLRNGVHERAIGEYSILIDFVKYKLPEHLHVLV